MSSAAREAIHEIMSYVSFILDIKISYSNYEVGDIAITSKSMDELTLGYSYMPGGNIKNSTGDIFINASFTDADYQKGGMAYSTILHELGHSLGLDHPYSDGYYAGISVNDTVMSYNIYDGYDSITNNSYSIYSYTSFQEADIIALSSIYGANNRQSDDTYILADELFNQIISGYTIPISDNIHTIYDNGGNDTISLLGIDGASYIDLSSSTQSVIIYGDVHHYLNIASQTVIENIIGSNQNDIFVLNSSHNMVDAKDGLDRIYIKSDDTLRIDVLEDKILLSSKESGLDTLVGVEQLYVNDIFIDTSLYQREHKYYINEEADDIARLYLSVFDRLADEAGLDYWINDYVSGASLQNIASSFVLSDEFVSLYGLSQSNGDYINLLYQNVLYRDADEAGLSYWLDEMQKGSSKSDILVSFSNSAEFIGLTQPYFQDGVVFLL